ncbi:MAG: hypothetical protein LUQ01_03780 [Methanolinea sp.]|nr:hypothetical protein [Methanolinea sp.]
MVAALLLGAFAIAAVLIQVAAQILTTTTAGPEVGDTVVLEDKSVFFREDFLYGPQSWRPYQSRLAIGGQGDPDRMWILMFIPVNGTPFGGNPAFQERGSVSVHYAFENLTGKAAFHVYGFRNSDGLWATNRQEEYGASAYYVIGSPTPATSLHPSESHPIPDNYTVQLSSAPPPTLSGTKFSHLTFHFAQRADSGLDSLHITPDLKKRKGDMVTTTIQEGEFFITHTGGKTIGIVLLMVAITPDQPDRFQLTVTSKFNKESG